MSVTKSEGSPVAVPESKRKRNAPADEELEIDLAAPEPPSKKAKRKEKKSKASGATQDGKAEGEPQRKTSTTAPGVAKVPSQPDGAGEQPAVKRSEYGIWIGNLPFTATREMLQDFFDREGTIDEKDISRVHLPTTSTANPAGGAKKTQNKGFAYVDFTSKAVLEKALALSEKFLSGRRVLIKDAQSFEGRPKKTDAPASGAATNGKPAAGREPTKKVFVGNLGFDVTREEVIELFRPAGEVEDIFLATFEDSGKCKGFGWVRFGTFEAAEAAVKGFVYKMPDGADEDDDDDDEATEDAKDGSDTATSTKKRKVKRRKYFVNRLNGRQLRCEFAEDAQTRYKKRFGKEARAANQSEAAPIVEVDEQKSAVQMPAPASTGPTVRKGIQQKEAVAYQSKDQRREERRKRHEKLDARTIAPGKALANTPRASGAIVAGTGKKMVFDGN